MKSVTSSFLQIRAFGMKISSVGEFVVVVVVVVIVVVVVVEGND